jgi:hypothetical protein
VKLLRNIDPDNYSFHTDVLWRFGLRPSQLHPDARLSLLMASAAAAVNFPPSSFASLAQKRENR